MYYDDHAPPHFHAEYQGKKAMFSAATGKKIKGQFPQKQTLLVKVKIMHTIEKVEYISGYKLKLYFSNGKIKVFDMEARLSAAKNMFLPLKDIEFFKKVKCEDGTIVWPNGVDLCPDVLYKTAKLVPTRSKPMVSKSSRRRKKTKVKA